MRVSIDSRSVSNDPFRKILTSNTIDSKMIKEIDGHKDSLALLTEASMSEINNPKEKSP
jgi:hypothetical protein